jgi:hypothetical protein
MRQHTTTTENSAIRRGVAALVEPETHCCPCCRTMYDRVSGGLGLSTRDVALVDAARELTLRALGERRPSWWRRVGATLFPALGRTLSPREVASG